MRHIVPRKFEKFDQYIRNTASALAVVPPGGVPTWQRLLLTQGEFDVWMGHRDQWAAVYGKSTDPASSTLSIVRDKKTLRDVFIRFSKTLLMRIRSSKDITEADRATFNLRKRSRVRTQRSAIIEKPLVALHSHPGRIVEVLCRMTVEGGPPKRHPECDVVEYSYTITPWDEGQEHTPIHVGPMLSGRARFRITLPAHYAGMRITLRARWKNISNDGKSGPWSDVAQAMVVL